MLYQKIFNNNFLSKSGLTPRAADLGYAPRFQAFFVASSVSRFGSESTLPPQAANASRWAFPCK